MFKHDLGLHFIKHCSRISISWKGIHVNWFELWALIKSQMKCLQVVRWDNDHHSCTYFRKRPTFDVWHLTGRGDCFYEDQKCKMGQRPLWSGQSESDHSSCSPTVFSRVHGLFMWPRCNHKNIWCPIKSTPIRAESIHSLSEFRKGNASWCTYSSASSLW